MTDPSVPAQSQTPTEKFERWWAESADRDPHAKQAFAEAYMAGMAGERLERVRDRQSITQPVICGMVALSGVKGEPIACGFPRGHDGAHAWATLPTFLHASEDTSLEDFQTALDELAQCTCVCHTQYGTRSTCGHCLGVPAQERVDTARVSSEDAVTICMTCQRVEVAGKFNGRSASVTGADLARDLLDARNDLDALRDDHADLTLVTARLVSSNDALRDENEQYRETREELIELSDSAYRRVHALEAENAELLALLRDVAESGVEFDGRKGYVVVQIDRPTWDAVLSRGKP